MDLITFVQGLLITISIGVIGGLIGWTIMGCILHGSRDMLDFWHWMVRGGWRE